MAPGPIARLDADLPFYDTNVFLIVCLSTRFARAMRSNGNRGRPEGRSAGVTARVFKATMALLEKRGFAAVTYQDVAALAGVSRATIYRHWPDTAALVADAVGATAAERIEVSDTGSLEGDLGAILRQIADFIASPTGAAAIVAGLSLPTPADDETVSDRWPQRWSEIEPIFVRAQARGEWNGQNDGQLLFATLAGALYFRRIVMRRRIDQAWILAVIRRLLPPRAVSATAHPQA